MGNNALQNIIWVIGGAGIIFLVSISLMLENMMSLWAPMPLYLVVIAWGASYFTFFVMPLSYIVTYFIFYKLKMFPIFVLGLCGLATLLNIIYFIDSWKYGIVYQGEFHVNGVLIENIFGFSTLLGLAMRAALINSSKLARWALLLLFTLLTWCAFPYFGELP